MNKYINYYFIVWQLLLNLIKNVLCVVYVVFIYCSILLIWFFLKKMKMKWKWIFKILIPFETILIEINNKLHTYYLFSF